MLTFQKKNYNPAEEITLHTWKVTRHKAVIAGSLLGSTSPETKGAQKKAVTYHFGAMKECGRRSDSGSKTDCCLMLRLWSWICMALQLSIKLIHLHKQLFSSCPRFHSEWIGLPSGICLLGPVLLLRMAFNCSFFVSPLPPSFFTSMVVGGSGIPLCPKSPACPTMAAPFLLSTGHSSNRCVEKEPHKGKQNHSDFLWLRKKVRWQQSSFRVPFSEVTATSILQCHFILV